MGCDVVLSKSIAGTSYQVTIFTEKVEELNTKNLVSFTPPKASANQDVRDPGDTDFGPEWTMIMDYLMVERRFNVDGYVSAFRLVRRRLWPQ